MASRSRSRSRRRPRRGSSDLLQRVIIALPLIAFAIFIIVYGDWVFAAGAFVLGVMCLHELFRMYEGLRPVKLVGFMALAGFTVAAQIGDERQVLLAAVAFVPVMFLLAIAMPLREGQTVTMSMAFTVFGVFWIGMAVGHAILLRGTPHGDGIIIDILVGTFVGDSGAYLGGRSFGTRRLAPRISPNKTVEGLVIGFLTAVLATWCAGLYQDWLGGWDAVLLGVAVGLAAPLGDLFESQVKRDAGTKDTGKAFGAHGGALDRLDAAFFTLVAGYYVWLALLNIRVVDDGDDRTREERLRDRQMLELLNEMRVALPGVQILFAFLLAVPFSPGFQRMTSFQRDLFYGVLIATAVSTTCLIAPTATHRLRFRQGDRDFVIETANRLLIAALVALAVAILGAVVLITDFMFDGARVWIFPTLIALLLVFLWFVRPLLRYK